jgi:hypothetical protein
MSLVYVGYRINMTPEVKKVTFEVDDALNVSSKLHALGIDHHWTFSNDRTRKTMTAYYDSMEQAGRLMGFLVDRAQVGDKVAWQQHEAHRTIEGWCQLCEMANGGECDGGCLTGTQGDSLFVRIGNLVLGHSRTGQSKSS